MRIRPAAVADAAEIARIYNQAVEGSTATFDTEPKTAEDRAAWIEAHTSRNPVFIAEVDGAVAGFGALTAYSPRPAWDLTAELACYVDDAHHQRGVGRTLSEALIEAGRNAGLHVIIARICGENEASLSLARRLGFREVGRLHEVGRKFDRWLDVVYFEVPLRGGVDSGG
jgi:phosphinothricin acetyltransferase